MVSIFVNPTQFGPTEDFDSYPRPLEHDRESCEKAGVDILFAPPTPRCIRAATRPMSSRNAIRKPSRAKSAPGISTASAPSARNSSTSSSPDIAFFGQKDYQQSVVVRRMVRDLNFDVKISVCPTVRESDGLAMSSRNVYLSPEEREQATVLYRALRKAEEMFAKGERRAAPLIAAMDEVIREAPLAKVDYVAVVNPETLREIRRIESEAMVLIAVRLGRTRLIDNCHLSARIVSRNPIEPIVYRA